MKKIFAVILALSMLLALAACGGKTEPAVTEPDAAETTAADNTAVSPSDAEGKVAVMTHDDYAAADLDTAVCVETYVQAKQSWWEDKATVYCQSPDGAYFAYNMTCSEEDYAKLVPGTKIQINGFKTEWSGEVEIAEGATFTILEGADTYIAEPVDVTELLAAEELIDHQNEFVKFTGMTVEAKQDADGNDAAFLYKYDGSGTEGDDLYFDVSYNGQTYTFTVESYLTGLGTTVYDAVRELKVGDTVDLEGFLYWYEGVNPHITAVNPNK